MPRKALAVLGLTLSLIIVVSAEALAQPTITTESATRLDESHILLAGTATCTPGTNVQTLGAFVSQREPRTGFGFFTPGTCPESGTLTWSVVVEYLGGCCLRPFGFRPGTAFVRAFMQECTNLCTHVQEERDLIVRPH
jgi:hypothetical protein